MLRKTIINVLCVCLIFCFSGCGETSVLKEGDQTIFALTHRGNNIAENIMDGNISTGWISQLKANDNNINELLIDFGKENSVSKIIIDDSFERGFTNKPQDFIQQQGVINGSNWNASDMDNSVLPTRSPVNVFDMNTDGNGWKTKTIPTESNPHWFYVQFLVPIEIVKFEINNETYSTSPVDFEVHYSSNALQGDEAENLDNYILLDSVKGNDKTVYEKTIEKVKIKTLMYSVTNQGNNVASLDEFKLFAKGTNEAEKHYPINFSILVSNDGDNYEELFVVNDNNKEVIVLNLKEPTKIRFVKYIVFKEYKNNFPSIGEIVFS